MAITYLTETFNIFSNALQWQRRGLMYTSTGFGSKIPTQYKIRLISNNRAYRLYAHCYSNCASYYIVKNGIKHWIAEHRFPESMPVDGTAITCY